MITNWVMAFDEIRKREKKIAELQAALRKLVEECSHLTPCGDDLIYDCCEASAVNGHRKDCSWMAAIAEAERLLGDAT